MDNRPYCTRTTGPIVLPIQVHTLAKTKVYIKRIDPRPWYTTYWPHPLWEWPPMFREITDFPFLKKSNFFIFLGPKNKVFFILRGPKNVFWPPNLFLPLHPWFWRDLTFSICWSEVWFLELFWAKLTLEIFSNHERQEIWPPLNHEFTDQLRFGGQKTFLGAPKMK